jgi:hypothetical protein
VRQDLHTGSDHQTLLTTVPGAESSPLEQLHYRVPESKIGQFAGIVQNGVPSLPDTSTLTSPDLIEDYVSQLTHIFDSAIKAVGMSDRGGERSAPWWNEECRSAYIKHVASRIGDPENVPSVETREFLATVRRAKREYWRKIIDGVKDDKDLYRVVGWHKLTGNLKSPPLVHQGITVEDTMEKAEVLRAEILGRFDASDDLQQDPLENWEGSGRLGWDTTVSMEEVERSTIGVSSTSPGSDKITVRLLKAAWSATKTPIHGLYNQCLRFSYFPRSWRLAEVAMLPKVGKRDRSSVRSWRPIALLSCISKGLERIVARAAGLDGSYDRDCQPSTCRGSPQAIGY